MVSSALISPPVLILWLFYWYHLLVPSHFIVPLFRSFAQRPAHSLQCGTPGAIGQPPVGYSPVGLRGVIGAVLHAARAAAKFSAAVFV
ncbi:MAG TPA: hypothetical protein DCZ12_00005, partial [Gammaproteobacteria bacterium]|nr:hypothetical protein [Gammaproteobacteria bacterium]